ncbi:HrpE/YscL family type III secretion apparatus protein [Morganella psychrotolerans]|uniref:HrpE/YscL family type III secretion apparatus protein n=1 Tax=Morganella psychrotolerans TaxID=368603 RepID=UPI0039AF239A
MPDDTPLPDTTSLPFSRLTTDTYTLTAAPCIIRAADYRLLQDSETLKSDTEQLRLQMQSGLNDEMAARRKNAEEELACARTQILLETRQHCREVITQLDAEITALVCHTIHILLEDAPAQNRLRAALRGGLRRTNPQFSLILTVHPDQADFLHQWLTAEETIPLPEDISVDTDNSLLPGDCLIRQGKQVIHATLENQLTVLKRIFPA